MASESGPLHEKYTESVTPAKAGVVRFNCAKKKIGKILKVLYLPRQESCTNHYLKIVISARA